LNHKATYSPEYPLNQIIQTIWVANEDKLELSLKHKAPLFTELIFNYGDVFQVDGDNVESFVSVSEHYLISGLKTSPFTTTLAGKHLNVGLILKPHYYGLLLELFASESMRIISDLFYDYLIIPETPNFQEVEKHLIKLLKIIVIDPEIRKFNQSISADSLRNGAINDFIDDASLSHKGFIDKFKRLYNLTPNEFIKLNQVEYAEKLIKRHPKASLTQIGLEAGFYDQSHFIRVFKKQHGITPKQFQKNRLK